MRVRTEYVLSCPTSGGGGESLIGGGAQTDTGGGNDCTWNLTNEVHYVYDGMRVIQERKKKERKGKEKEKGSNHSLVHFMIERVCVRL